MKNDEGRAGIRLEPPEYININILLPVHENELGTFSQAAPPVFNDKLRHSIACKEWRDSNIERCRERQRIRTREAYRLNKYGQRDKWRSVQAKARKRLSKALESGKLEKPEACQVCHSSVGSFLLHGHHEDYSKPLEVVWLCSSCHGNRHSHRNYAEK